MTDYNSQIESLASEWGVHPYVSDALPEFATVTTPNAGVPAQFTTYLDPQVYKAIVTPTKSEAIYGQGKRGDWTDETAQFAAVELTGSAGAYGDNSNEGISGANANFIFRQSYLYQTYKVWGDKELATMSRANIDWMAQKNLAALQILNKTTNAINLFGVAGLQCFGALNDPALPAAITPTPKSGGASTWDSTTDPLAIFGDILKMFGQIQVQTGGNVDQDSNLTLVIPTELSRVLLYTNTYNVTLKQLLTESFPNLKIETLPEASPALSGGLTSTRTAQLFVRDFEGQNAVFTAFNCKAKEGRIEQRSTAQSQKVIAGTWGTVWVFPAGVVSMTSI